METNQPTLEPKEASYQSPQRSPVAVLLSLLTMLLTLSTSYFAYQNMQLQKQIVSLKTVSFTSSTSTPTPTEPPANLAIIKTDPTTKWNTYTFSSFSIALPPEWSQHHPQQQNPLAFENYDPSTQSGRDFSPNLDKGLLKIEVYTSNPINLRTYVDNQKTQTIDIRGTSTISWTEVPTQIGGQPAIKFDADTPGFSYAVVDPKTKNILALAFALDFDRYPALATQVLSTFKFLDQKDNGAYTCPSSGWVDCMPNSNAGVRFECEPEAFTWYKANCPNFQGGAL